VVQICNEGPFHLKQVEHVSTVDFSIPNSFEAFQLLSIGPSFHHNRSTPSIHFYQQLTLKWHNIPNWAAFCHLNVALL